MKLAEIGCFIFLFITSVFLTGIHGKPPFFIYNYCFTDSGNYTANSFYQKNLNSLLTDLSSESSSLSFSNSSTGTSPDDIYGIFFCRYDLPSTDCSACVKAAVAKLTSNCTQEKEAMAYYEQCTVRYANRNIFSLEEEFPERWYYSLTNVSMNVTEFYLDFSSALDGLIKQAAYNTSSPKYFKTLATRISSFDTLYVLVQCTPDISALDCDRCLRTIVRNTPKGSQWVMFFQPSCQMRYDLDPFFVLSAPPPSPSPPPPSSPSAPSPKAPRKGGATYYVIRAVIPATVGLLLLLIGIVICLIMRRRARPRDTSAGLPQPQPAVESNTGEGKVQTGDQFVQFDFRTLDTATSQFSQANKLGQGGFGVVYRGVLQNGQHVAVKRLSKVSGQGVKEFKTEIEVVAQLQHRNLVRLVGYCIEGEERLVVYEFLPNLSLDNFLFGSVRGASLTWAIRYKIIVGIARGLHYLHDDSRIKIVHRDLKTSNILLDNNLDPKVADFGMARLMQVNETQAMTTKVVGTFGYIAPEYALAGRCTPKSDIYSFGVIILEILSGKSCSQFYQRSHGEGLLRYAWRVWSEDAIEQLVDPILQNNYSRNEVERCLRISLLCVQDDEANRPTTQALFMMLSNNSIELPSPFKPALYSNSIGMPAEGNQKGEHSFDQLETDPGISNTWYQEKDLYAR